MVDVLRIVFFGTPAFAVPSLQSLLDSRHVVVGVVTQPDRPRGRGQDIVASPVKELAVRHDLPLLQPERLKDEVFLRDLRAWRPDLGVVAAYGKILPAAVLDLPPHGLINVHASLLPRHRGAAPIHRAVIAGDTMTGISIMGVVQALDAGPVFARVSRPIGPDDTSVQVERDLAVLGAGLLTTVIDDIAAGSARAEAQDESAATYASKLDKNEGLIDWSLPGQAIHQRVRGLQPWPMAWTFLRGRRLIIVQTRIVPDGPFEAAPPGTVTAVLRDALRVQTGTGPLDILAVQPEGRRVMTARDFAAGARVAAGEMLTPAAAPAG